MGKNDTSEKWMYQTVALILIVTGATVGVLLLLGQLDVRKLEVRKFKSHIMAQRNISDTQKYNIIIVLADDLGWADVSWNNDQVKVCIK